jgi:hypothetical protein
MKYSVFILLIALTSLAKGQTLESEKLNDIDVKNGVAKKYNWQKAHAEGAIQLILFKNNRFKFTVVNQIGIKHGEGNWRVMKDTITLNTDIKKNDVPIKIVCNNDTAGRVDNFNISIPRNLNGVESFDCMVRINNDSVTCLPSYGQCDGRYASIDSIKAVFDNGMSSRWIPIINKNGSQMHIIIQTDFPILTYYVLDNKKYKISSNYLLPVNE